MSDGYFGEISRLSNQGELSEFGELGELSDKDDLSERRLVWSDE